MKHNALNIIEKNRSRKIKVNVKSKKINLIDNLGREDTGFLLETDEWGFPIE
jgi:hypothetical protein